MDWLRRSGRVLGFLLLSSLLVPVLAAWPVAFLDRGPDGPSRFSVFPMALAILDPFVWSCVLNSVLVASLVAAGSMGVGLGLGLIAGPWRFWGRGLLWSLGLVPLAAGPLLVAPGISLVLGDPFAWEWLAARSVLGFPADTLVRWLALVWTGLASGVPLVALTTSSALGRIDPVWVDAARAFGATRPRAWRDLVWPILRPELARVLSLIIVLNLVEPVAPLVFSVRRTLAFQIVETSTRDDQPTRMAALSVLAVGIAIVARLVIRGWGGGSILAPDQPAVAPSISAGPRRTFFSAWILTVWAIATAGPVALLVWRALEVSQGESFSLWLTRWTGPEPLAWLGNSITTAALAVVLNLVLLRAVTGRAFGTSDRLMSGLARVFETIPPLCLGVGAVVTPWLLAVLADLTAPPVSAGLRWVARELAPGRSPGFLLALTLACLQWPMMAEVARLARGLIRPVRLDAARLMGADGRRWARIVPWIAVILAFAHAAANVSVAVLLTPSPERRTLATAALASLTDSGPRNASTAGIILVMTGMSLLALGLRIAEPARFLEYLASRTMSECVNASMCTSPDRVATDRRIDLKSVHREPGEAGSAFVSLDSSCPACLSSVGAG